MSRAQAAIRVREERAAFDGAVEDVVRAVRRSGRPTLMLDGRSAGGAGWPAGPWVALDPVPVALPASACEPGEGRLAGLGRLLEARRRAGGTAATGIAVVLGYDALRPTVRPATGGVPQASVLRVDRTLSLAEPGHALLTAREEPAGPDVLDDLFARVEAGRDAPRPPAATIDATPRTSLPRRSYMLAVRRVQRHIARGDIYQANLCQQFRAAYAGDAFETYATLAARWPAPHSAFVEVDGRALASISPETFLLVDPTGRVETRPIKGTRPRGTTPAADEAARHELLGSAKDRAELLMIVDLERNDLGRICRTGSVEVPALAELQSFPAVHHLVARVCGRLRPDVGAPELLGATFPGGSITGAPKLRAIEILDALEPVARNWFTGCLLWFGDDGSLASSILIRSLVFSAGTVMLGAGGGVVADSDPHAEWLEANHKARALARAIGFDPEQAR